VSRPKKTGRFGDLLKGKEEYRFPERMFDAIRQEPGALPKARDNRNEAYCNPESRDP